MYIINGETIINESPTKRKIIRDFDYDINGVDDVYKYFNSKHNFKKRVKKGSYIIDIIFLVLMVKQ